MPDSPSTTPVPTDMDGMLLRLVEECGAARSISPEDVARAMAVQTGGDWHRLLGAVRQAGLRQAQAGRIDILRKGKPAGPGPVKGVVRFRLRDVSQSGTAA